MRWAADAGRAAAGASWASLLNTASQHQGERILRLMCVQGDGQEPLVVPLLVLMARQLGIIARQSGAAQLKAIADLYDKTLTTLQQVSND